MEASLEEQGFTFPLTVSVCGIHFPELANFTILEKLTGLRSQMDIRTKNVIKVEALRIFCDLLTNREPLGDLRSLKADIPT